MLQLHFYHLYFIGTWSERQVDVSFSVSLLLLLLSFSFTERKNYNVSTLSKNIDTYKVGFKSLRLSGNINGKVYSKCNLNLVIHAKEKNTKKKLNLSLYLKKQTNKGALRCKIRKIIMHLKKCCCH